MNWPNLLTWVRIAIVPMLVVVYLLPFAWSGIGAMVLFLLAALTDALDGHLARQLNQTTASGEFLDPVADKLLVAVTLILVTYGVGQAGVTVAATIIIWREIAVAALRQWAEKVRLQQSLRVSFLGKAKTITQMIALIFLLLEKSVAEWPIQILGVILLYLAAILSVVSMIDYFRAFRQSARNDGAGNGI